MSDRKAKARLYKEPEIRRATTAEGVRDLLAWLAEESRKATPAENLKRARQAAQGVLGDATANDEARRLAQELVTAVDLVESMIARPYDPALIVQAMAVGWKWRAMIDSLYFAKAVDDVRRRDAVHESQKIPDVRRRSILAWWSENRPSYRSDNAARAAYVKRFGGKSRTVQTVIESDKKAGR
jgi:hypothetical protein